MAMIETEILKPGRYCLGKNESGEKVYVAFSRDRLQRLADDGNAMIRNKINVPIVWDHDGNETPVTMGRASPTPNTLGSAERFELRDGSLWGVWNVPDEQDAKRAGIVNHVSPDIDYFTDDTGRDWGDDSGGVILHVAVTNKPVRSNQTPIVVRMGRRGIASRIRLGRENYEGPAMDDENKDEKPGDGDGDEVIVDQPESSESAEAPAPDPALTPAGLEPEVDPKFAAVLGILAKYGLVVPQDTTPENLFDRVVAADMVIEQFKQSQQQEEAVAGNVDDEDLTGRPDIQVSQPGFGSSSMGGVTMSRKQQPTELEQKLAKHMFDAKRAELRGRLTRLEKSGLFDASAIRQKLAEVPSVRMSLNSQAKINTTELDQWITAREEVVNEHAKKFKGGAARLGRGKLRVVEPPEGMYADEARGEKGKEIAKLAAETAKKLSSNRPK